MDDDYFKVAILGTSMMSLFVMGTTEPMSQEITTMLIYAGASGAGLGAGASEFKVGSERLATCGMLVGSMVLTAGELGEAFTQASLLHGGLGATAAFLGIVAGVKYVNLSRSEPPSPVL